MSFSDSPQPPPFMPPLFAGGDIGEFWPQIPVNSENPYSYSQLDYGPPFKRPRDSVNNLLIEYGPPSKRLRNTVNNPINDAPFPPMNTRMIPPNPPVNVGTTHIFYKTRTCLKFTEGNCRNGENCTFAHGAEELRQPPPNWQELVSGKDRGSGNWNDDQRIIHRMKICKKFYNGEECPYGDKCNFLHENPLKFKTEMGKPQESSAISSGTMGPMMGQSSGSDQPEINMHVSPNSDAFRGNMKLKPAYWKTKICSKWEATGHCPFMERCHFAHGESELQLLGSRVETEVINSWSIPTKPLSAPANDVSPTRTLVGVPTKEEGEDKKRLAKWKGPKKINRIYGDWIDDLTSPRSLPSTVES